MGRNLLAWTDGGGVSTGDTEAYIGVVITDKDTGEILCEHGQAIGKATVNEAEYSAVLFALYWAVENEADRLEVKSDSLLIVNQINGKWKVTKNGKNLGDYLDEAKEAREGLLSFKISWIPREENVVADSLSWRER